MHTAYFQVRTYIAAFTVNLYFQIPHGLSLGPVRLIFVYNKTRTYALYVGHVNGLMKQKLTEIMFTMTSFNASALISIINDEIKNNLKYLCLKISTPKLLYVGIYNKAELKSYGRNFIVHINIPIKYL